jgi:hypothetical protein
MKYVITESQYKKLSEQFDFEEEDNIVGNPSENTLMIADFLLTQNLVDIRRMLILDDVIEIYGFENGPMEYFQDNKITFNVITRNGDVHINVEGDSEDNYEKDAKDRFEVYNYIMELAKNFQFVNWYIEGTRI